MKRENAILVGLLSWLTALAFAWLLLLFFTGCGGFKQTQRAQAERDIWQLQEQEEVETHIEGGAEDVTIRGISEERLALERERLQKYERAEIRTGLMVAGLILIFLVAPAVGPDWLKPAIWLAGLTCVVAGTLLPVVTALF